MILFTFSVQHVSTFLFIVYCVVLCTLISSTISAFKKIYTSKFASKLWKFVNIWLDDAFVCILLIRLWFHWIFHTWKHTKRHFTHVSILSSCKGMPKNVIRMIRRRPSSIWPLYSKRSRVTRCHPADSHYTCIKHQ